MNTAQYSFEFRMARSISVRGRYTPNHRIVTRELQPHIKEPNWKQPYPLET